MRVWGDSTIDGDLLFGDDNRATPLAGIDVLDFSGSVFSWHLYMNPGAPNGNFVGKTPLSSLSLDDPRFIQPTPGVNGVVEKLPGVVVPGETYPGIPQDLRVPDPNSPNAGGEANNIGEFEHIIAGGSPDGAMTIEGRGGGDVLYAGQGFSSTLIGGDGNDLLSGGAGTNLLNGGQGIDIIDYGIAAYGLQVEMAGVGSRIGEVTGSVDFLSRVLTTAWADSVTDTAGPTGAPDDIIQTGTTELRSTYQVNDQGIDDPSDDTFIQQDAITPERILRLDPFFALTLSDLDDVAYLPDQLLPEQRIKTIEAFIATTDLFQNIEQIAGGKGDDSFLGNGENTCFYGGIGADTIDGGSGVDTSSYAHSAEAVSIDLGLMMASGGDAEGDILIGIESLVGTKHGDLLSGGAGNDTLDGGLGLDTMDGGDGDDVYHVDQPARDPLYYPGQTGDEVIERPGGGIDTVICNGSVSPYKMPDYVENLIIGPDVSFVDLADNALDNVIDGGGLANAFIFAEYGKDTIGNAGYIFGGLGDDVITGSAVSEQLHGNEGNDSITGSGNNEQISLGQGDDTAYVYGGNDTLYGSAHSYNNGEDGGNDIMYGGAGNDILRGGLEVTWAVYDPDILDGDDQLFGGTGDDTLYVVSGNDTVWGGADTDLAIIEIATTEISVRRVTNGLELTTPVGTHFVANDIESFQFSDTVRTYAQLQAMAPPGPTTGDDSLDGTAGADTIVAKAGDDTVNGLGGNDSLVGGPGADSVDGAAGLDRLKGFGGDDTLIGGFGADLLVGGAQNDSLVGGNDGDTYVIGDAGDVIVELAGDFGRDRVESAISFDMTGLHVEDLTLTGSGDLTGTGDDQGNRIEGNAGNNSLAGAGGDDTLVGGPGDDTLVGGAGNDTAVLAADSTAITVTVVAGGLIVDSADGSDFVASDVEFIAFSDVTLTDAALDALGLAIPTAGDDLLDGTAAADTIDSLAGNDTVNGLGGDDSLIGGDNDDLINGGWGGDTLLGQSGNDTLMGNQGADRLDGGSGADAWFDEAQTTFGNDTFYGGWGNDTIHLSGGDDVISGGRDADSFVLASQIDNDTIFDFTLGVDALEIDAPLWNGALDQAHLDSLSNTSTGRLVLEFDNGNTLRLNGLANNAGLLDDIALI